MLSRTRKYLYRLRLTVLVAFTVLALAGVYVFGGHQQMPLVLYKLSLAAAASVLGIIICRRLAPYARPDDFLSHGQQRRFLAALQFRALIIAACIIGVCLAL